MLESYKIGQAAAAVGFDVCGICRTRNFSAEKEFFDGWLERGFDAGLGYLRRNVEKRFSPEKLIPGARSVIVCGVVYKNDTGSGHDTYAAAGTPKVASYARSADYHVSIKSMLAQMASMLEFAEKGIAYRAFTDTAPLLEKRLAVEAGLGFIGRNTLLVSPWAGSYILLGELVVDAESDAYGVPYEGEGCGECRRCVDNCPSAALTCEGLDARKCLSRITIEPLTDSIPNSGEFPPTHGWIFGCDDCQDICPYNAKAPGYSNRLFAPVFHPSEITADEWLAMTEREFEGKFSATPLARSGLLRIKRMLRREKS